MTEQERAEGKPPANQADVLIVLADTIQSQAHMQGQTVQALNVLREKTDKIDKKIDRISKKVGVRNEDANSSSELSTIRGWTENKLLVVFLIIMALAVLALAGVKVGEVTGFFKQIAPVALPEPADDKK